MERLLDEAVVSRKIVASAHVQVDLGGFGRYLPTANVRRDLALTLPPPPPVANATVTALAGPVTDPQRDGITTQANVEFSLPAGVAANIGALWLDIGYGNVTIVTVEVGPVSVPGNGTALIPISATVKRIADASHEAALVELMKKASASEPFQVTVSGADPSDYDTVPRWLRQALRNVAIPVSSDQLSPPLLGSPSFPLDDVIRDVVVDKLYAHWSAKDSYQPWARISGQATIDLPNPSGSDVAFAIESLTPNLCLLDDEGQAFATVDTSAAMIQVVQEAPSRFVASCDFDRLGLSVLSGKEPQFTQAVSRVLGDRRVTVGVNGTLDVSLVTSIGRMRIDSLPFHVAIDRSLEPDNGTVGDAGDILSMPTLPDIAVTRIHVVDTRQDLVALEIGLDVDNPLSYGAHITDLALMVNYSGLHIATVGVKELSLAQGASAITVYVDFFNHIGDPRQQMLFLEASAGNNVTLDIAGFPNCTSIAPLEASLRRFSQKVTIDPSSRDASSTAVPQVLQEVVFHLFAMSAEATVVNPVSGAPMWLQTIKASGYYDDDIHLGTLEYDFTSTQQYPQRAASKGLVLPYNRATTTPRLPIAANETSIGWDVLRKALGGTLDVDVFTSISVLVGNAPLNFTVMGRNAPVKVRL
ncbi:hypothetical protein GGF46_002784 [Coemansia sp. RSA 552]|nr:hypothetical protein GGF46_002784 [Coemansia sp. RSA 552]